MSSFWDVVLRKDEDEPHHPQTKDTARDEPSPSFDTFPDEFSDEFRVAKILASLKEDDTGGFHIPKDDAEDLHMPTRSTASTISLDTPSPFGPEGSSSQQIGSQLDTPSKKACPQPPQSARLTRSRIAQEHPEGSSLVLIGTMDHSINQTESAKQKARNKANIDNSVKRLTQEVDDEVGGKPPDDASIEAWDRYLNDFMEAMQRRDEEHAKNSWTQLGKAEQFINKMRQQEFRLVGDNIAEGTLPRSSGSTVSHQRKGRTERNRAVKPTNKNRGPVELSHGVCGVGSREISRQTERVEESERQAAPIDNPFARSPSMLQNSKQPGSSTAAKHTLSSDPVDIAEGRDDQRPMKKRRSGPAALESNLGKNWEPHVDAEGHRPSRNKSKKS